MTYSMVLLLWGLVLGLVAVASNPSPYFAAFGLVMVAGFGCGVIVGHGGAFLSLILFLIYLGGMLVVFAYSAALAAEPYPESWGSRSVAASGVAYVLGVGMASFLFMEGWHEVAWLPSDDVAEVSLLRGDVGGVSFIYSLGGKMLVISVWVLLLTLLVVLELTRGLSRASLRAV